MLRKLLYLQNKHSKKVIGLMSGTSADGIDACLAEIDGNGLDTKARILEFETYPYDKSVRNAIIEACDPKTGTVDKICALNFQLGALFATAAKSIAQKAKTPIKNIDLIGTHGQTIYHLPLPHLGSTLQIGEPSVIAYETGVTTVADFRPKDVAAGGQGAPLVPYIDFILFRDKEKGRSLLNIGGIANLTFLPLNCSIDNVIAFDTGPGNMIIDRIAEIITEGKHHFDKGGELAKKGEINYPLLAKLLKNTYLSDPPPKTTGREAFGKQFADILYKYATHTGVNKLDILTTVTAFTAKTIADSHILWILSKHSLSEIIISGGGSYNKTLIKLITQYLPQNVKIYTTDKLGIPPNAKEALAFAILANETISENTNNVPSATGAKEPVIMGKIVLGGK